MPDSSKNPPRSKPRLWIGILVGFLALLLVVWIVTIFLQKKKREIVLPPPYTYPFTRLPFTLSKARSIEREIAFYQERSARDPKRGLDLAMLASAYLKMGRVSAGTAWYLLAEEAATQSIANLPFANKGALLVLANVAAFKHDFPQAIHYAMETLKVQAGNEDALSVLVTAYLAQGDLKESWKIANELVGRIPKLETYSLRALVEIAQGRDADVRGDFKKGFQLEEAGDEMSSAWARSILGRYHFSRGRHRLSRAFYYEALRIIPQFPQAVVTLIELEIRERNFSSAEMRALGLLELSAASPRIYDHLVMRQLARIKFLEGDQAGARLWWHKAEILLRKDPGSFGHRRELARLLLERGELKDVPEALSLIQQELHSRHDAETLNVLAWALSRSNQWPKAYAALQRTLHSGVKEAEIYYRAGTIAKALGRRAEANRFFHKALQIDPTFDEVAKKGLGL